MSSMMYQKADKRLLAEDIPKNTITNKSKLLKGNHSYWNAAKRAGNHICAVYGDYVEDMEVLAEMLDMEVIRA